MVCRTPGRVAAILTADCLPIVIGIDGGAGFAAVHAGWRGLAAGVVETAISVLAVDPAQCSAWIGPAIGASRYEVDGTVRDAFITADPGARDGFSPTRPGHWACDLAALARQRLARAGVSRVAGGDWCTYTDVSRLHSHRRDGAGSGRIATLVWLHRASAA